VPAFRELNVWRLERTQIIAAPAHAGIGATGGFIPWVDFIPGAEYDLLWREFDSMQLPGLDRAMLGHLLMCVGPADYGAEDVPWYDADVAARLAAGSDVRYLHAFALEPALAIGPVDDELPRVYRRDVHFLASDRWVITRRREGMALVHGFFDQEEAVPFDQLRRFVENRWRGYNEPQDAATLILRALADTWLPATERVSARLANSELLYVRGLDDKAALLDDRSYWADLVGVKWVVDGLSGSFTSLRRPGVVAKEAWFRAKSAVDLATEVEQLLALADNELKRHREQIRQSFDLIASTQTSRQVEIDAEERRRGQRLEQVAVLFATVFLAPTLIAAVFDALPNLFGADSDSRMWILLALMVGGAALTYLLLQLVRPRPPGARGGGDGNGGDGGGVDGGDCAGGRIVPSGLFVLSAPALLFAALLVVAAFTADDWAAAFGVVLLAFAAFIVAPQLIASRYAVTRERRLFNCFGKRATPRRTRWLSRVLPTLHVLLLLALVVFSYLVLAGAFFCDCDSSTMLVIAYAMAPALYAGFVLLWLLYTTRAARAGRGERELVGLDRVHAPLERSGVAGVVATACFVGGTALLFYAAWSG
jgi:hypothetical protein